MKKCEGDRHEKNHAVAEQRTGRWEKVYGDHISAGHRPWTVCCSECGMIGGGTRYCSNCGAKMEQDNETY